MSKIRRRRKTSTTLDERRGGKDTVSLKQSSSKEGENSQKTPFWETKSLEELTKEEWEALCDGCGRCCLNKLEDQDTGEIFLTKLSCSLLNLQTCRCSDYKNRFKKMPDCVDLTPQKIPQLNWLPSTCAYRKVQEGRGLSWWHPLISGDASTVHKAGISVQKIARSEKGIEEENFPRYILRRIHKAR